MCSSDPLMRLMRFMHVCANGCKMGDVWLVLMGAKMSLWLAVSFLAFSDSWKTSQYITLTPGLPVVSISRKMRLCMESIRSSTWRMWVLQSRTIWLVQLRGPMQGTWISCSLVLNVFVRNLPMIQSADVSSVWHGIAGTKNFSFMFFHFICWMHWIDTGLFLWKDLTRSARTCPTQCGTLTWMTSWRRTPSTVVFPRRGEKWGNEETYTRHVGHRWSWRLANFGCLVVWLGDSLDFVSWNMKKWTISRCYRYHHCRSASNLRLYPDMKVLGPARDTAEYAAWHVEPYSVPCHSGLAKCCWYIYDDLRISMHMYTSSADWVGNCSQCKVELCMWSFHIPESLLV